ncbi:MAG: RHS repeat-associated core domain-containing protein [Candidatus Acidiferrum sp.]
MTPSDQQISCGSAYLAVASDAWPVETMPEYPQASYYRARYYDASAGRFIREDPMGFYAGINKYAYVRNNPMRLRDPRGMWPWDHYYQADQLTNQTDSDLQIYHMTSKFLDPFVMAKCPAAVPLAQINQLAGENLDIDGALQGGMAIGLLAKYPEVIGEPQSQMLETFGKLRDANNRKIDAFLNEAAAAGTCNCGK